MNLGLHETIFLEEFNSNSYLQEYLGKEKLKYVKLINEGRSAWIVLVSKKGILGNKYITIKLEKSRSTRTRMAENEAKLLKKVNRKGIGPEYIYHDLKGSFVVYKYFDGIALIDSFDSFSKPQFIKFLENLFMQAHTLDLIGVDHGQLAGKGTNILVLKNKKPIIVDFEKASNKRKTHNVNVLMSYFFSEKSKVAEEVLKVLGSNFLDVKKRIRGLFL